ncbi:MAG: single-strand DNA-binding protein [Ilumatobacter sp.]
MEETMNINLAVIRGTIINDAIVRALPAGTDVAQFDVSTSIESKGRTVNASVPVALHQPSSAVLATLVSGADVAVVGRVERRFFRSGGITQSRTELIAERVVPARRTQTVRSLFAQAAELLTA